MSWQRKTGWAAVGLALLLLVAATAGYFYLKSSSFEKLAIDKIVGQAELATGGKTTIGTLKFDLSTLTARLSDITLRGTERPDRPPLMHIDKLTVRIKIVSALHRQVSLRELLIEHPVAHVEVSHAGGNNLPAAPPPEKPESSHTSIFDLAVEHVRLSNGEINYNDRKTPVDADLHDLATDIRFSALARKYDGELSYNDGHVRYGDYASVPHSVDLKFSATPEALSVNSATFRLGSSELALEARVSNYSNPTVDGSYGIRVHTQDLAQVAQPAAVSGDVLLRGKLHYQSVEDQPFLRAIIIEGDLASPALLAASSGKRIQMQQLHAYYTLAGGNLQVKNLSVESLGGRITASAEVNHLDSTPASAIRASLQDISLRALQQSFAAQEIHGAALSGIVGGTVDASWKGAAASGLQARSDLTLQARATSRSNPSTAEVPVNGTIHASYDGSRQTVYLHDTILRIPSANLTAQGTVGDHSSLQLQVLANDLHQLAALASSFGLSSTPPAITGSATLSALVRGSVQKPAITAQFDAQNLHVQGSDWTSAKVSVRANPSEFVIENASLLNARRGEATFSGSVQLHNWAYQPSNTIRAQLDVRQIRIADLQAALNQHYPISGELSAKLSLQGSQDNPVGSGDAEIANAVVYGERINKLGAKFRGENGSLDSALILSANAGTVDADLSYTPRTKAYKIRVDAPAVVLQKVQTVQARNLGIAGTVAASVNGEGSLDDPEVVATIHLPELQAQGRSIYEMKADARIAQHRLNINLDSKVSDVSVHAHGQVALSGEYETDAAIDTGTVPLDALMATYAPNMKGGFQGQTEVHATLKGPLKNTSRLEAHLSIPTLNASYQSLQLGIDHPIRADYSNSVVTIQPADIRGTGTSLHVQGTVPIGGTAAPTLTAHGSIDVRILRIVAPEVESSGTLALDIRSSGTAANPSIQGQVHLNDVAATSPDAPLGIEKLNGTLDIANDRVQVSEMTGQMGGGQVTLGGSITYRPSLTFNLAVKSQSVRLLYPDGLRSLLDANLSFTGTAAASTLSGRVLIDNLSFTPDFDLSAFADQFSTGSTVSQPGFADTVQLAIGVQSRENLNATSSQISIAGQAALQVGGTAANPVITGRTTLTAGELFYRNVRYQLQRGVITFDDPNQTHPVLNVSVTTAVEQYNLTLTLRGPLDKLTTAYVSDPPLATADIINLVARGKTIQEQAASSQSTDSMIASQAASQVSSSVQKLAGISSLQIDPTIGGNNQNPSARVAMQQRVTKNLLFTFSTDVSQPGSEIIQGEYQINKRWSVSMGRDRLGGLSVDGKFHRRF